MSGNFKFKIDNLEQFKKNIQNNLELKRLLPDLNSSVSKFASGLESRVDAKYGAKVKLSSVLVGRNNIDSLKNIKVTLEYKSKTLRLDQFRYKSKEIAVTNSKPFRYSKDYVKWTKVNKARKIESEVRKGRPSTYETSYAKFKLFKLKNRLYSRLQKETWEEFPSFQNLKGKRKPIKLAFGPSLATLARSTYLYDKQFQKNKEVLQADLIKALLKYYK